MICLIDADTLVFGAAVVAEEDGAGLACSNANNSLDSLLGKLNNPDYKLYVTGTGNFRYKVYPEYKANRIDVPRPKHLGAVKTHLIKHWGAIESDGCEADDLLGIEQTAINESGGESQISSVDKDLLMIPGWHHVPEMVRKGVVVREERRELISPLDGLRFFYTQLLTGDTTDNIKGVQGVGKVGAGRLLAGLLTESHLFEAVRGAYGHDEELEMNARCLWIQRYVNEDIVTRWKELFGYERMDAS